MNRIIDRIVVIIGLYFCMAVPVHAMLVAERLDLGEQRPGKVVKTQAIIRNDSDKPIVVLGQQSALERIKVNKLPVTIPPRATAYIDLDITVDRKLGSQNYFVDLGLDNEQKSLRVKLNLFVNSAIDNEPKQIDFGVVPVGKQTEQRVDLTSRELPQIRARAAQDEAKLIISETVDEGRAIVLRPRTDAPWGMHQGWVHIETNSDQQPAAWIKYRFEARGRVVPETYEVNAGVQRVGSVVSQILFIRDLEGGALDLGKVLPQGAIVDVKETVCPVKDKSCRALEIRIDEKQPPGRFFSTLNVELPQYKQTLAINYAGVLLAKDIKIHNIDKEVAQAQAAKVASSEGAESPAEVIIPKVDIKQAIQQAVKTADQPPPPGKGPLLKWSVAHEETIYGYLIYRADQESGPFVRVNKEAVRVVPPDEGTGSSYQWRDTSAEQGKAYWYYVGLLMKNGTKQDLSGPQKIIAK